MAIVAKIQNRLLLLRLSCWLLLVIAPAGLIGWLARVHNAWILAVGIPMVFLVERLFRSWVRWYELYHLPGARSSNTGNSPAPDSSASVSNRPSPARPSPR